MSSVPPDHDLPGPPQSGPGNVCPACGLVLPPQTPVELCPQCLLGAGMRDGGFPHLGGSSADGDRLGPYQLGRRLGSGGMGEVYEADDLETGRRVALKILSQRLDSPDARRRFFNEGRLAASINHPHSVYVFGTEEIAGVPVISMELMSGGTLEEAVREQGPMAVAKAVDAILQIIAGLSAAQAAGILHRDIKPSNCFFDADGTVKIGDYGLSISSKAHERGKAGDDEIFIGTPAFASPEQVRGDDLTMSSDIYSVGVTLYFLLTGKAPYEARDQIRLLAKVLESPAPDLRELRRDVPRRLADLVRRCLAKCPSDRFVDYQELRAELTRFSTSGKRPAEPWQRLIAGVVDFAIIGLPVLAGYRMLPHVEFAGVAAFMFHMALWFAVVSAVVVFWIAYFTWFEWKFGKTPGKALLGLEVVVEQAGQPAWKVWVRRLGRSSLLVVLPVVLAFSLVSPLHITQQESTPVSWTFFGHRLEGTSTNDHYEYSIGLATLAVWSAGVFLLFVGAHRRDGWLAVHDWLTDTTVVANVAVATRPVAAAVDPKVEVANRPRLGPFHLLEMIPGSEEWWIGYDPSLLRKVWLRQVPHGAPPVTAALRNLRRAGRLRWLAGIRSAEENWDAYEFLSGQALLSLAPNRAPWCQLRLWMADLAAELSVEVMDGTRLAAPCLEEIWITGDGRAKLLDFPAPGIGKSPLPAGRSFWVALVDRMLENHPLPLPVRGFLQNLPTQENPAAIMRELEFLAAVPTEVTRHRRLAIAAASAAGPLLLGLILLWINQMSPSAAVFWTLAALIGLVALPAIIVAAVIGDGLIMRGAGVSVVDRQGRPARGFLAARRSLMAWLPTLASPVVYVVLAVWMGQDVANIGTLGLIGLIAGLSAVFPDRTLHDRLAGTWLVPR